MFLLLYLLKNVEIVINKQDIGESILKQRVLKALANPPRIFYVPYSLALLNFLVCFLIFVVSMVIFLLATGNIPMWLPLVFLGILSLTHTILGTYSKKEPQLSQIIFAKFAIFKQKIPNRLAV